METATTDDPTDGPTDTPTVVSTESAADDPTAPPPSIATAVRLMWVGAVVSAAGVVVAFLTSDDLREEIAESDSSLTANQLDDAVALGLTLTGLIGVAIVALWIWMAVANGQGQLWARTMATVLGVLDVTVMLLRFVGAELTPADVAIALVHIALAVAILVLLYRPESNRFYGAVSRRPTAPD